MLPAKQWWNNPVVWLLGVAVTAFGMGFGAFGTILKLAGRVIVDPDAFISKDSVQQGYISKADVTRDYVLKPVVIHPPPKPTPTPPHRAAGWYGWANVPTIDRDNELHSIVGPFLRVQSSATSSSALCRRLGLTCQRVLDWQNYAQTCDSPRQGTRITYCG
jgi:hypothetical protein